MTAGGRSGLILGLNGSLHDASYCLVLHPIYEVDLPLQVDTGPDLYWAFFGPKPV